jgi:acetate---CoA ligase (ADP-forming)
MLFREVLASYGLHVPRSRVVHRASDAVQAAETIGYPVALKLVSREILHKTDVGGVRLNLSSADEVQRAFESMHDSLAAHGIAAKMEGAMVQEMVAGGVETYVGMTQAPGFGALVGFGIGGVNVELWKDVAFQSPSADGPGCTRHAGTDTRQTAPRGLPRRAAC